jgi:SAM-dependent methyltransferase
MEPLLYGELAPWYRLIDPPEDHQVETSFYQRCFARVVEGPCETLLELGAGGGHNALHLKGRFRCTLTDPSDEMRAISAELNPDCEHVAGDMRTMRLSRTFDAVLVHDAVCYMASRADLEAAARTAYVHTRPGGAAVFIPDCVRESYSQQTESYGTDEGERSARYIMWTWDPDPSDETYRVDFAFLLRDGANLRAVHDTHIEGLFSRQTWLDTLHGVGFSVEVVQGDPEEDRSRVENIFVCRRAV